VVQMRSILRTAWRSVKCCALRDSCPTCSTPQQFHRILQPSFPVVCPLQRIYFLCCVPPHVGAHGAWKHPSHGTESRMECLYISLDAHTVGPIVCPQCSTRSAVNLHRQYLQVLALVGEPRAAMICRCGAVFQALVDLRCHLRSLQGRVPILPIHSRRRGICPRGN
jgi:hypothetical protein